jgi:hypothetical protein
MVELVRKGVTAAEKSEMPGFIKPQLATLKAKAPSGDQWLHEIKFDGYRVQVHLNKGKRKVYTRNGLDWTKRFSVIAGALDIPGQAIIDGEVVVVHKGRANFSELQAELAAGRQDRLVFYAFDLLWRDGDHRKLPQIERKQMLSDLLGENDIGPPVVYSEHLIGDGQEMFELPPLAAARIERSETIQRPELTRDERPRPFQSPAWVLWEALPGWSAITFLAGRLIPVLQGFELPAIELLQVTKRRQRGIIFIFDLLLRNLGCNASR